MRTQKFLVFSLFFLCIFIFAASGFAHQKVIKIGAIYPLSGNLATTGLDCKRGVEMAVEIINGKYDLSLPLAKTEGLPNLGGAKIEVIFGDSKGDPRNGMAEAERLVTQENRGSHRHVLEPVAGLWVGSSTRDLPPRAPALHRQARCRPPRTPLRSPPAVKGIVPQPDRVLVPLPAILGQLGLGSCLVQAGPMLRPPLRRPRLPSARGCRRGGAIPDGSARGTSAPSGKKCRRVARRAASPGGGSAPARSPR